MGNNHNNSITMEETSIHTITTNNKITLTKRPRINTIPIINNNNSPTTITNKTNSNNMVKINNLISNQINTINNGINNKIAITIKVAMARINKITKINNIKTWTKCKIWTTWTNKDNLTITKSQISTTIKIWEWIKCNFFKGGSGREGNGKKIKGGKNY